MWRGDLTRALNGYNLLIHRNQLIAEILPDLAGLASEYPREAQVWQTPGDAPARAGRQDQAKQSYEQARKISQ